MGRPNNPSAAMIGGHLIVNIEMESRCYCIHDFNVIIMSMPLLDAMILSSPAYSRTKKKISFVMLLSNLMAVILPLDMMKPPSIKIAIRA
jgi:hypothetical protein